jgi:sugar (pentulose or hexulose) kinase
MRLRADVLGESLEPGASAEPVAAAAALLAAVRLGAADPRTVLPSAPRVPAARLPTAPGHDASPDYADAYAAFVAAATDRPRAVRLNTPGS